MNHQDGKKNITMNAIESYVERSMSTPPEGSSEQVSKPRVLSILSLCLHFLESLVSLVVSLSDTDIIPLNGYGIK